MNTYTTSQVAAIVGVHPNTVRLYETLGLIPTPRRLPNGYRIFTDLHISIFRLARTAFQVEVMQNGLRHKIVETVKTAALGEFDKAISMTHEYLTQIQTEKHNAAEAIDITQEILYGNQNIDTRIMKRHEVSQYLNISMDSLRNWEMNGLLTTKRSENGYRIYTSEDIQRLKIIRTLRCANYSLSSILRMLSALSHDSCVNIQQVLNTPADTDDIIAVCDKLTDSLQHAERNAHSLLLQLEYLKTTF